MCITFVSISYYTHLIFTCTLIFSLLLLHIYTPTHIYILLYVLSLLLLLPTTPTLPPILTPTPVAYSLRLLSITHFTTTGRFSCELSIADELVLTEMIFDGLFNNMSIIQITALMSAFVHKVSYLILNCV